MRGTETPANPPTWSTQTSRADTNLVHPTCRFNNSHEYSTLVQTCMGAIISNRGQCSPQLNTSEIAIIRAEATPLASQYRQLSHEALENAYQRALANIRVGFQTLYATTPACTLSAR